MVPLYRAGDVDALREIPGVDWNAVRDVSPGRPSALRTFVRRPPTRAQIIRRVPADLGTRFSVEVWAYFNPAAGRWEIDWETVEDNPTRQQIAEAIADDPVAKQYRKHMALATEAGAAVNWARAMLEPGAAVICDTETTDLFISLGGWMRRALSYLTRPQGAGPALILVDGAMCCVRSSVHDIRIQCHRDRPGWLGVSVCL